MEKDILNNNEDNEVIVENLKNFIFPKFQTLQEKIVKEKPGMFKMLKIMNNFKDEVKKDYEKEFNRDFDKDIKIMNDSLDNYSNLFDNLK